MKKKLVKVLIGIVISFIVLLIINSIPTWNLKSKQMSKLEGMWVTMYYEKEEDTAKDVLSYIDENAETICKKLGFSTKQDVNVYIYDYQKTMQTKKYGMIVPLLKLDWHIGDNIGTDVILTSPANPGPAHDYDSVKFAVLHEIAHAYTSLLNPHLHLWLKEGIALYLTNGEPFYASYLDSFTLPSDSDIRTKNPIKFANMGGYSLAHTYIEYLDVTYGWEKVLELIKTENYSKVLESSETEIYKKWVEYLNNYQDTHPID